MIRLFSDVCKCFCKHKKLNEIEVITKLKCTTVKQDSICPNCGAPASAFHKDGHYERDFICYEDAKPAVYKITIFCVECSSCGHAHGLVPSIIVPYSSYSLGFLLSVIHARITKRFDTVERLCEHFELSITTYYRICKRFVADIVSLRQLLNDIDSFLGLYEQNSTQVYEALPLFYKEYGYSFLQPYVKFRKMFLLKNLLPDISRYIDNGQ